MKKLLTISLFVMLVGCSSSTSWTNGTKADHGTIETYIRAHISDLSPVHAVLGGTFYVTNITWDGDTAVVKYEDGHIAVKGQGKFHLDHEGVIVDSFTAEQL